MTEVSRDYTINLHKRLFKTTFKTKKNTKPVQYIKAKLQTAFSFFCRK